MSDESNKNKMYYINLVGILCKKKSNGSHKNKKQKMKKCTTLNLVILI